MKLSYYDVFAKLDDGGALLYNTNSQTLVELDRDEAACLERLQAGACNVADIDAAAADGLAGKGEDGGACETAAHERGTRLVSELAAAGFLVDDPEVEADLMLRAHNAHRNNTKAFELTISPTRTCNCHCDYCYIDKRPGFMSPEVQDSIVWFVEQHYAREPFRTFRVVWYGGEPLLAIDIVESLSARLAAFCDAHGVRYMAHMLTNGLLADAAMCRRLRESCRLETIMPTISGYGPMHGWQRPANDDTPAFETLMRNIDHMLDAGLTVHANFVVNRNNFEECKRLAAEMRAKPGIVIRLTRTFAYGREGFTLEDGRGTPLELFTREEFASYYLEFHRALGLDAAGYREVMQPICMYCAAWHNNSFFVDERGDMFACMIDMDLAECVLCNLVEMRGGTGRFNWERFTQFATMEPARDATCRSCRVLPICQGGCAYCSAVGDDVCHDLKGHIEDFVRDYHRASVCEQAAG